MTTIKVFPRRTKATPFGEDVFVGPPPIFCSSATEVHISVTFSYDLQYAEWLERQWKWIGPVKIGGPAVGDPGGEFIPGQYLCDGYVITSRGCKNKCWFCDVWKREGATRELIIKDGYNILDSNLLACSEKHIRSVFDMLGRQHDPIQFTGGFEAKRLKSWHVDLLLQIKLNQVWFAYDEEADYEPLVLAGRMLRDAGINITATGNVSHKSRCYCLVGWSGDTMTEADKRLRKAYACGFLPMAMLYRDREGKTDAKWRRFQRAWARPASINRMCRDNVPAVW
jgi:hypothetical protein